MVGGNLSAENHGLWFNPLMNPNDYLSLLASLDRAVAILDRNRTPDPESVAAYDTLKQARARITAILDKTRPAAGAGARQLVAA